MAHTLKLKGDPVIPGLALPEAFESLEKRVDSTIQLCRLKGSMESQVMGVITVCQELQRLLKCAFVENGMLATRIQILTRYHNESIRKMEKKVAQAEMENKVTRKHMKRLRKRLTSLETLQRKKGCPWWDVNVRTTDYDSVTLLSRTSGVLDLEFMLRVNQLMIDFVSDKDKTELVLPAMGGEERQEVAKLASVYKLRCRYGKAVQVASSTLLKARQAYMPAPGEVDAILENFTKQQRRLAEMEEARGAELHTGTGVPPLMDISSTMLTPLSTLTSPTIDLTSPAPIPVAKPPHPSPPATPGPPTSLEEKSKKGSGEETAPSHALSALSRVNTDPRTVSCESPIPSSIRTRADHLKLGAVASTASQTGLASREPSHSIAPLNLLANAASASLPQEFAPPSVKPVPLLFSPITQTMTGGALRKPSGSTGGLFFQHHGQIRPIGHPTVVASPLKIPASIQLPPPPLQLASVAPTTSGGEPPRKEGGAAKRDVGGTSQLSPAPKRLRVTRRSVEEEHSKT